VLNVNFYEVTDEEIGFIFLKDNICVHLDKLLDKYNCLLLMIDKLLGFVIGKY